MLQEWLKDHRTKIILWGVFGLFIIYWGNATWVGRLHGLERKIHTAFGQYRDSLNQRAQILPQLIDMLKNYAPEEQALMQELYQNYEYAMRYQPPEQILSDPKLAGEYAKLQNAIIVSVEKTEIVTQKVPALAQNRQFYMLMNQWSSLSAQISNKEIMLNRYIEYYNSYLNQWPQSWYNKITYRFPLKIPSQMPVITR